MFFGFIDRCKLSSFLAMSPFVPALFAMAAPLVILGCGLTILIANPSRKANRAVFCLSIHISIWLTLRELCSVYSSNPFCFRACITTGSLILMHLAYTSEVILTNSWKIRSWAFALVSAMCLIASILPWFNSFARPARILILESYGGLYFAYLLMLFISFSYFLFSTAHRISRLDAQIGDEIRAIIYPASTVGLTILLLMLFRRFTPFPIPRASSSILIITSCLWLSYSVCTAPLFGAQELFKSIARITAITIPVAITLAIFASTLRETLPTHLMILLTYSISILSIALLVIHVSKNISCIYSTEFWRRSKLRRLLAKSISEDAIRVALAENIEEWTQSELTIYSSSLDTEKDFSDSDFRPGHLVFSALAKSSFITPETAKDQESPELKNFLVSYLNRYNLGALIASEGGTTSVIFALKNRADRRPFTVRDAQQLIEYASLASLAFSRVRLLSQVAHADRLVTLGILGASIAHEIRNPLFAIKTFADLLPTHYDSPEFRLQFSKMVGEEAKRIDSLLSDMMTLGKPRELHFSATQINAAVVDTVNLLGQKTRSSKIEVNCDLSARHDTIDTDAALIRQVILNLFLNAIQALHDFPGDRQIDLFTANTDRGFEFAIRDSGPGIPPKDRKKLFVRFNTSKKDGTGLGLWLCRELVTSLGGSLDIDPYVPGEGATFRMILPQSQLGSPSAPKLESAG